MKILGIAGDIAAQVGFDVGPKSAPAGMNQDAGALLDCSMLPFVSLEVIYRELVVRV